MLAILVACGSAGDDAVDAAYRADSGTGVVTNDDGAAFDAADSGRGSEDAPPPPPVVCDAGFATCGDSGTCGFDLADDLGRELTALLPDHLCIPPTQPSMGAPPCDVLQTAWCKSSTCDGDAGCRLALQWKSVTFDRDGGVISAMLGTQTDMPVDYTGQVACSAAAGTCTVHVTDAFASDGGDAGTTAPQQVGFVVQVVRDGGISYVPAQPTLDNLHLDITISGCGFFESDQTTAMLSYANTLVGNGETNFVSVQIPPIVTAYHPTTCPAH